MQMTTDDIRQSELSESDKKKRFLKRYKKQMLCLRDLEDELAELDNRIKSPKGQIITDMPRGGTPKTMEDRIAEKIRLEERINRRSVQALKVKAEIQDCIDTLSDHKEIKILEKFFIECLDFDELAENQGYSRRHIERIYKSAIDNIDIDHYIL